MRDDELRGSLARDEARGARTQYDDIKRRLVQRTKTVTTVPKSCCAANDTTTTHRRRNEYDIHSYVTLRHPPPRLGTARITPRIVCTSHGSTSTSLRTSVFPHRKTFFFPFSSPSIRQLAFAHKKGGGFIFRKASHGVLGGGEPTHGGEVVHALAYSLDVCRLNATVYRYRCVEYRYIHWRW